MSVSFSGPAADVVSAINTGDTEGVLTPLAEDVIVNDRHRLMRGRDAVRDWYEREIADGVVTIDVADVREHYGDWIVSGPVTGVPDEDRLALYFSIRNDMVVRLVVLPMAGHPLDPA
ncbi:hypothetical protein [Pseudonocardia sp. NPDC046786]|uniref:hypothetical protein n=1 Tax=Pseudonocardia sp. NPDC046786 TaxID=3155471 RepID=UPI00340936B3